VRRTAFLFLAFALGCASKPAPKPATDDELAYEDQTDPATRAAIQRGDKTAPTSQVPLDARYPEFALLKPTTTGTVMTIVAVTEVGPRGGPHRPAAMIFSSDKDSPYLQERPRQSRVLKPMDPARMDKLLADLRAKGLDRLPSEAAELDARITSDRQFIFIRDGKRSDVKRSRTLADAQLFQVFAECEKLFLACSSENDPFVETRGGGEQSDRFVPLNPDTQQR
jgi:hypothetical protein